MITNLTFKENIWTPYCVSTATILVPGHQTLLQTLLIYDMRIVDGPSSGLKAAILACHVCRSLALLVQDGTRSGRWMCHDLSTFFRRAYQAVFIFSLSTTLIEHALLALEILNFALVLLYLRLDNLEIALADSVAASSQWRGARPVRERVHLSVASIARPIMRCWSL